MRVPASQVGLRSRVRDAFLFLPDPADVSPPIGRINEGDEAHKYMTSDESRSASTLTNALLSTIRLQHHLGVRVVVSTQEPTVSSPAWMKALRDHLACMPVRTHSRFVYPSGKQKIMPANHGHRWQLNTRAPYHTQSSWAERSGNPISKLWCLSFQKIISCIQPPPPARTVVDVLLAVFILFALGLVT